MIKTIGVLAGALFFAMPVAAQTAVTPISSPTSDSAVLRTGTEVPLRLSEELTTKGKKLRVGQRVHLETAEPVIVQGVTVIPVGSPAIGEITDVKNKGMWGKSGHLGARVLYVTVNGRQIRLSGAFDDKGTAGTAGVVGAAVLLPVAGFFVTRHQRDSPGGDRCEGVPGRGRSAGDGSNGSDAAGRRRSRCDPGGCPRPLRGTNADTGQR